jgi:bifunctional NMN adenylyltransferase/nudix hydrolase
MYENGEIKSNIIPLSVKNYIEEITLISYDEKSTWYENILNEYNMIKSYKKSWEAAPYPPTFVTTDAVVIQSGYVLMVKRKFAPGKGLWALPGGFLEQSETLIDGMIRELREETKLKVPVPVIKGSIKQQKQFDKPDRSSRGRTITTAFLVDLGYGELPKVKGTDDAEKAKWIPLGEVDREKCFEDHFSIISHFTGIE